MSAAESWPTVDNWEAHPAATIFPLMNDEQIEDLAVSIMDRGQEHPIIVHEGKILDGRNRIRACGLAGVAPQFQRFNGDDPTGFVVAMNLRRMHYTTEQRAAIAASPIVLEPLRAEAKARQIAAGLRGGDGGRGHKNPSPEVPGKGLPRAHARANETIARAAKMFDTSEESVRAMVHIHEVAPDVHAKAIEGKHGSVNAAARAAGVPMRTNNKPHLALVQPRQEAPRQEPQRADLTDIESRAAALLKKGHTGAEVARMVGISPSAVSDIKARAIATNPLAGPLAIVCEAACGLESIVSTPSAKWAQATADQRKEVLRHLEVIIGSARKFHAQLKQGLLTNDPLRISPYQAQRHQVGPRQLPA